MFDFEGRFKRGFNMCSTLLSCYSHRESIAAFFKLISQFAMIKL